MGMRGVMGEVNGGWGKGWGLMEGEGVLLGRRRPCARWSSVCALAVCVRARRSCACSSFACVLIVRVRARCSCACSSSCPWAFVMCGWRVVVV